ncbi:hypothetical protein BE17_28615 [Sorangium cellulosum]|uniref:Uncharacterized protein n=1 Tax=Sorangium cellulosum TaxID=56 RepID=A0A150RTD6_SORCE|nr:hypothetical protein BE17_28615 [Sorangium cellulosum]
MSAHAHRHAIDGAGIHSCMSRRSAGLVIAPSALQMLRVLRVSEALLPRLPLREPPLPRGASPCSRAQRGPLDQAR